MSFDLFGDLPTGTMVLEASAGTGKTHAIATLATRYVAEGRAELSQLMLVTFGRAATQELRERTRQMLTEVAAGLLGERSDDPLVQHLAGLDRVGCRRRLLRALADFDAATIATTHSFCQRMLDGLGFAGERDPGVTLVESVDDLVSEVVDDVYLRWFSAEGRTGTPIKVSDARDAARSVVGDRGALIEPRDAAPETEAGQRVALALEAATEVARRKAQRGLRDFDDLLHLLRDVLADAEHGEAACARLQQRYAVVLVDEFQDTDPVQWEILRLAFHGSTTLILVGDPKQAIYAFRGAEVLSYLDAVGVAGAQQTLTTNYRADADLVAALAHVYEGAQLGDRRIVAEPVHAQHPGTRMPGQTPLCLRQVLREGSLLRSGFASLPRLRKRVAEDVASHLVELLDGGATYDGRPVEPGDVAVIVNINKQAAMVQDELTAAGVPSVLAGSTSVFATEGATDWLRLLEAIEQPHRTGRVRLAARTALVGWSAAQLALAGDDDVASLSGRFRDWSKLFGEAGLAAVFEQLARVTRLESRLLGVVSGERRLTDLRHVAQVLNRAAVEGGLGLTALVSWLLERTADRVVVGSSDRSRRLESDAAAVQVMTVHGSKGLEFPVVYVPYGWDQGRPSEPSSLLLHDDEGQRVRDIGGKRGPGWAGRKARHDEEQLGEELRLTYVALTRARSQVVVWWAPGAGTAASPLQRLLMGRGPGTEVATRVTPPDDVIVTHRLAAWALPAGGLVDLQVVGQPSGLRWSPPTRRPGELVARTFSRSLDRSWRRTSYSSLTAATHDTGPGVGSEAEQPGKTDEPEQEPLTGPTLRAGAPSAFNAFAGGAAFGTLVHEVLEQLDTSAADLAAEVAARCADAVARRLAAVDPVALAAALVPVLHTPIGGGVTLAGIAPRDRLPELDFELPLAGGDHPADVQVTLAGIADLLREHLPADDVLASYADLLDTVEAAPLRGFLGGSIDAVLRLPGPRFVVVDYKTNRLGRGDLTVRHYARAAMAAEMVRAHYPLQALLYTVAVHRYLRWRQPAYDAASHLGGVQYHFVRGMVGPETPPGCGVFDWTPPASLVVAVSDLLAGQT